MSAFQVYLLMMADSVCVNLTVVCVICGIGGMVALIAFAMASDNLCGSKSGANAIKPWIRRLFGTAAVALALVTFIPDTKTLASMYVLPKLTTPHAMDTMSKDGQQLYDLTIAALKHMAGEDKK